MEAWIFSCLSHFFNTLSIACFTLLVGLRIFIGDVEEWFFVVCGETCSVSACKRAVKGREKEKEKILGGILGDGRIIVKK